MFYLSVQVKTATQCEPVFRKVNVTTEWQECRDMKVPSCKDWLVCKPFQEKIHKFKCLSKQDPNDVQEVKDFINLGNDDYVGSRDNGGGDNVYYYDDD